MRILIVGGAVRDNLLKRPSKDVDYLVTGATPEQMIALGYEQVGADFPVFLHPETKDEYALARIERKTGDGYHGFAVDFDTTVTVEDDLSRRDLTINAMAFDPKTKELIDPFGGQRDLEGRILRHVSPAFAEDPLRVVRLARFAARYFGFTIANSTMSLSKEMVEAGDLNHLPSERFWVEMEKALGEYWSGHFFWVLNHMNAFEHVTFFRELFGEHDNEKFMATSIVVGNVENSEERLMFFSALLAKPDSNMIFSAPVRTQKLFTNINRVRNTKEANVETIYTTLMATRVWSQSSDFDDLARAMRIAEGVGEKFFIDSAKLREIVEATKVVAASQFPEVQGKALGEAIANARKEIVKVLFNA